MSDARCHMHTPAMERCEKAGDPPPPGHPYHDRGFVFCLWHMAITSAAPTSRGAPTVVAGPRT